MSTMVERVAGAIGDAMPDDDISYHKTIMAARAAISAMREPPEEMLRSALSGLGPDDIPWMEAVGTWQCIIDEALK